MKIQQLLEREPFGEILERTVRRFFDSRYGRAHRIHWRPRQRSLFEAGNGSEQVWFCNPALNVLFTAQAQPRTLGMVGARYAYTPFPWRRPFQKPLVTLATHPRLASWFTRFVMEVMPAIPESGDLLLVGGNNRICLIDMNRRSIFSILKEGFDPVYMQREAAVRRRTGNWPIPPLLRCDPDLAWIEERYVDGLALNRIPSDRTRSEAEEEAVTILARWLEPTTVETEVRDYVDRTQEEIRRGIAGNHLFDPREQQNLLSSVEGCVDRIIALTGQAGEALGVAEGHGDFQPGNILLDPGRRLWLVDWEHSCLRQVFYDPLVYLLKTRFPQGLSHRLRAVVDSPRSFFRSRFNRAWPGFPCAHPPRLRMLLLIFLLEEMAWYVGENSNPVFLKPSGGWLAFHREFCPSVDFLGHSG